MTHHQQAKSCQRDRPPAGQSEELAICCRGLGKAHILGAPPHAHLANMLCLKRHATNSLFWALKDVSFSVKRGESVGIIGRNGAGKSTLLQIIAGIISPTNGEARTRGRVAALLELGTGFNPEFTGKENVQLGATILGLKPEEINERMERIEQFAGLGQFFNYPVKRYSSGMQARLAFSLIAHVDADILIVDEALAVGDMEFSQKCMRFLRTIKNNTTLCFVSHDISAVTDLCDTALWLSNGMVKAYGEAKKVCQEYQGAINIEKRGGYSSKDKTLKNLSENSVLRHKTTAFVQVGDFDPNCPWQGFLGAKIEDARVSSLEAPLKTTTFGVGEMVKLTVEVKCKQRIVSPVVGFAWKDSLGQEIFGANTLVALSDDDEIASEETITAEFRFQIPALHSGKYYVTLAVAEGDQFNHIYQHWIDEALTVEMITEEEPLGIMEAVCEIYSRVTG